MVVFATKLEKIPKASGLLPDSGRSFGVFGRMERRSAQRFWSSVTSAIQEFRSQSVSSGLPHLQLNITPRNLSQTAWYGKAVNRLAAITWIPMALAAPRVLDFSVHQDA
jgi:hypothetical protein